MPELVALDLPAGQGFVDALRTAWEAGDAVLPLDPRLPRPATRAVVEAMRPSVVIDGTDRLSDGAKISVATQKAAAGPAASGRERGHVRP